MGSHLGRIHRDRCLGWEVGGGGGQSVCRFKEGGQVRDTC